MRYPTELVMPVSVGAGQLEAIRSFYHHTRFPMPVFLQKSNGAVLWRSGYVTILNKMT